VLKLLLAADNDAVRELLQTELERDGFDVVPAQNVRHALRITPGRFDVPLSDLHMPHPGDGFAVTSATRHTHPQAVTLVLSGHQELDEALSTVRSLYRSVAQDDQSCASLTVIWRKSPLHSKPLS
jgi:DNA-binding NtrC family response regulator